MMRATVLLLLPVMLVSFASEIMAEGKAAVVAAEEESAGNRPTFRVSFEGTPTGTYTHARSMVDFANSTWQNGLDDGRAAVVAEDASNKYLRVSYGAGTFSATNGGVVFLPQLPTFSASSSARASGNQDLYVSYRIRFPVGFDFVKGGKLPGLCGGECNAGGKKPLGYDGFSVRVMWRGNGTIIAYVYHFGQRDSHGEILLFTDKDGRLAKFIPGVWHRLEVRVKLNAVNASDGLVEGWLDGVHMLRYSGLTFRSWAANVTIDKFAFSTFYGGATSDWAPPKDNYIHFDDFNVTDTRTATGNDQPLRIRRRSGEKRVMGHDFERTQLGVYSPAQASWEFGPTPAATGLVEGHATIHEEAVAAVPVNALQRAAAKAAETAAANNRFMRVTYKQGTYGGLNGVVFLPLLGNIDESFVDLTLTFRIRFKSDFGWVNGGKFPGLCSGDCNSGGGQPSGYDGFSARGAWRPDGVANAYVFYVDQPGHWGDFWPYINRSSGRRLSFHAGAWHNITMRFVLNNPWAANGQTLVWLDGNVVINQTSLRLRLTEAMGIDQLCFSTFFGGGSPSYAASRDESIDFDDFAVTDNGVPPPAPRPPPRAAAGDDHEGVLGSGCGVWCLVGVAGALLVVCAVLGVTAAWRVRRSSRAPAKAPPATSAPLLVQPTSDVALQPATDAAGDDDDDDL